MLSKKNPEVDNERLRIPLMFLGFFIVGSIITLSFSFKEPAAYSAKDRQQQDKDKIPEKVIVVEEPKDEPEPEPVVQQIEQLEVTPDLTQDIKVEENEDVNEIIQIEMDPIGIEEDPTPVEAPIVDYPDQEATFPGGAVAMKKYLASHIQYPEIAMELGDQGRVFIEFVVNQDGSIEQVKILRGVSKEIDLEAKRVVRNMPNWIPAESGGEKVRARCRIPINFILQ